MCTFPIALSPDIFPSLRIYSSTTVQAHSPNNAVFNPIISLWISISKSIWKKEMPFYPEFPHRVFGFPATVARPELFSDEAVTEPGR